MRDLLIKKMRDTLKDSEKQMRAMLSILNMNV